MISYDFLGFPLICYGSYDFHWFPVISYDFLWFPVISYGFLWFIWVSYDFHRFPMIPHAFLCFPMIVEYILYNEFQACKKDCSCTLSSSNSTVPAICYPLCPSPTVPARLTATRIPRLPTAPAYHARAVLQYSLFVSSIMICNGFLWFLTISDGFLWFPVISCEFPWILMIS